MTQFIVTDENDTQAATVTYEGGKFVIRSTDRELAALNGKSIPLRAKPVETAPDLHVDFVKNVLPTDPSYVEALTDYCEQLGFTVTQDEN